MIRDLIVVRGLNVWVDGQHVLRGTSFDVYEGNVVLVVGPSGSGKSTLLKTLSGVIPSVIRGEVRGYLNPPQEVLRSWSLYVHQEPWFFISTPYVWSEVAGYTGIKSLNSIREVLNEFGLNQHLYRTTYTLSAGEIQRLAFIIASNSKNVVLLDEPTSYLDRRNSEVLVRFAGKLVKDYGRTIVVVDHDISLWEGIASKVLYMYGGMLSEVSSNPFNDVVEYMVKALRPPESKGGDCMRVCVDSFRFPDSEELLLTDIDFEVCRGEVVVVRGPSGSGKTTLLKLIAEGYLRGDGKVVSMGGHRGRVVLVPDNPLLYLTSPTPVEEVGEHGIKYLEYVGLIGKAETPVMRLSSGERRRLAIASALSRGYEYVLIDEPTAGLDPLNKSYIIEVLIKAAGMGAGFIIASHDPFLERIANKVVSVGRPQ